MVKLRVEQFSRATPERAARGSSHGNSRLTESNVDEILSEPRTRGYQRRLADRFGVAIQTINGIVRGRAWRHRRAS